MNVVLYKGFRFSPDKLSLGTASKKLRDMLISNKSIVEICDTGYRLKVDLLFTGNTFSRLYSASRGYPMGSLPPQYRKYFK